MSFLKNTISLMAIFSVMPAAYAVTARPSVVNTATAVSANGASRRMPTMTAYITGAAGTTTVTGTTSSTLLANAECIDAYTACIKGGEACGPNFEECTTKVLFHAKMPQCLSTLAQCQSAGVNSLFGTTNVSALSNVATKNTYGEITDYTYPTNGSVLGQMISAAAIENMYDTSNCVRRYSSCLRKESVCGEDFELCTTNTEFKKQAVFCDSTLARCASDGKKELFGNATATSSTAPGASSRIGEMIAEGAALAAVNAVSTCYKVVDQCILGACTANPYKCYENSTVEIAAIVDAINNGTPLTEFVDGMTQISKSNISSYIRNACMDTIGSNKYCYATFIGDGMMPSSSQLRDEDNQAEIYDMAYSARMNSGMKAKITELVNKFDTRAKEKCIDTIKSCAMRTCGGGSGAACYSLVFSKSGENSINGDATREDIKTGCASIVNTDANCKYAAQNPNSTGTYNYSFVQGDAFDVLFPEYDGGDGGDPINVVATLNASLSTSYNDAAIAQMKKRCQSVATSCVKSMCGNDYVNCYRNRTDVYSSLTNTGEETFDKSMNKVGGVLDYTIVLGLCIDTVKNADVCAEHLAIEQVKYASQNSNKAVWGGAADTRTGWLDAGSAKSVVGEDKIYATDENGNRLCRSANGDQGLCDTVGPSGAIYSEPVVIGYDTYVQTQAARSLFKDLIYDLEIEAQAKYNAKLTKEQNMCLAENSVGGVMGNRDNGSLYMWVKLKSNKVPSNYSVAGLKPNQFVASNDLYGSFCRVRVTLQSDDKRIQDAINNGADWSTAYFAIGDAFTCGSWIPDAELQKMADAAGADARADKKAEQPKLKGWMTALGALGIGGIGTAIASKAFDDDKDCDKNGVLGKLCGDNDNFSAKKCQKTYDNYLTHSGRQSRENAIRYADELIRLVNNNKSDDDDVSQLVADVNTAIGGLKQDRCKTDKEIESAAYTEAGYWSATNWNDFVTKCSAPTASSSPSSEQCNKGKSRYYALIAEREGLGCNDGIGAADYTALNSAMRSLNSKCQEIANADGDDGKKGLSKGAKTAIVAASSAVAGGVLTYFVTDSIQKANLDKAEREAIDEFMNNVGNKINCYIGSDNVATYGHVVGTALE